MYSLQYLILSSIQRKPLRKDDISKRINRFRIKKIPGYFIERTINELEDTGLIEEISSAEESKILTGNDPDEIEIVASDDFIGKYTLSGTAGFLLIQEYSANRRRFYIPLCISALSLLISIIALFVG